MAVSWKIIGALVIIYVLGVATGAAYFIATTPPPTEKVHLLFGLDWIVYGRHAAYFVAVDKGYFDQEGLSVEIIRGYGSSDAVQKVATGRVDVAFGDLSSLIIGRAKDPNLKVKMVAMIYGKAPFALFYLKKAAINTPKDLEGKTLTAGGAGDVNYVLFPAFAKAAGFDATKVKWQFLDPALKVQSLVAGQVDVVTEFAMQKPVVDKAAADVGGANMMLWADHGFNVYSNGIMFKDDMIQSKPNVVRGFLRALAKAFDYAFKNSDEAVDILLKRYPTLDKDVAKAEVQIVQGLVLTPEAQASGIGSFDPEKVQVTIDTITTLYDLPRKVSSDEVISTAYLPGK